MARAAARRGGGGRHAVAAFLPAARDAHHALLCRGQALLAVGAVQF